METTVHPIGSEADAEPLREALGWLVGRECWQAHSGYDLWLDFGPERPRWTPGLAAHSMSPGAAFDRCGALCFVTGSSGWAWRLATGETLSDEDGEEELAVALAHVSRRRPVLVAGELAYPGLAVELRFDDDSVLTVTPEAEPLEHEDDDWWHVGAEPFAGGPVEAPVTICVAPGRCVVERR
jgi:hypothetical protein